MLVPVEWLYEYVRPDLGTRELAERLAMTGTEVDRIHYHGVRELEHFVIGKVLEAGRHPDADRLTVCVVDTGDGEPAQIVCGAPNVAAGQTVAVARPGAIMPDGTKLGRAKLRGVESAGMILAEDEIGAGTDHDGIMVLDDSLPAGAPLADALPIGTDVLELEITPNRPDCLGVYGVAREVHAATGAELAPPPWSNDPGSAEPAQLAEAGVVVEVPELCPRFTARVLEDVTIGPSPWWLKARLLAAGQRPINNVVDITNYVMLLTGQPLHAFDLDRVAGHSLVVRRALEGEKVTTLDDVERTLDPDVVLIADDDGPTSIAGVMGGARSEVHEGTTRVLMEVATWDGPNINRTSWKLGLRSEASARFEKGLSPEQAMEAQIVATQLMLELTGARLVHGTIDVGGPGPEPPAIQLRERRVESLLGAPVPADRCAAILDSLGFTIEEESDPLLVRPPHFRRRDVTREADLIEEVSRIDGVDKLPATIQENRTGRPGRLSHAQRVRRRAEDVLVGRGLHEVVGWSFTEPALLDRLRVPADDHLRNVIRLENPMSEAQSVMRSTVLGSLLDIASYNHARGMTEIAIFESGGVYHASDEPLPYEHHTLAALLHGKGDYFAAKALLEAVSAGLRVPIEVESFEWPFLHPGRSAAVKVDGNMAGWVGEVHPLVTREWDLEGAVPVFAVDVGRLVVAAPEVVHYADVTSFPSVRQDLAVVVGEDVTAARVVELVRAAAGALLARADIFDVYRGEQVGEGRKSLALHCEFRAPDRTLTDDDVARVREQVVAVLRDELGGELRA